MLIFAQSAKSLKGYVSQCIDKEHIQLMAMRMVLAFILHRGRMSCSAAAGSICSDSVNRGEVTRCLARGYWRKIDLNSTLVSALLAKESKRGAFLFIVDATQKTLAGRSLRIPISVAASRADPASANPRTNATTPRRRQPSQFIAIHLVY